ncbi:MAG TPA: XdhC family protein [Gemmatimonadaceae bacterium]|nr:XdhC family protein [Gemmatimonadaceae bacterium]
MPDLLEQLQSLRATERRVAMATLVGARGGSPRPLGAKLFVGEGEGGRLVGSVSIGGCVDARVVEHGERLLREDRAERVTVVVDDTEALELGLACGAEFDMLIEPVRLDVADAAISAYERAILAARGGRTAFVVTRLEGSRVLRDVRDEPQGAPDDSAFVERFAPPETLVLVGASDVGAALARLARTLGFRVVVVDGRDRYATRERFASADEIRVGMPSDVVRPFLTDGAYLVLASHEYKYELPILRDALRRPLRFVGMLAGRKRAASVRGLLSEDGLSDDEIARLHAPIGLDIGGREPEEIALSIAAQLIAVREGKPIARRA